MQAVFEPLTRIKQERQDRQADHHDDHEQNRQPRTHRLLDHRPRHAHDAVARGEQPPQGGDAALECGCEAGGHGGDNSQFGPAGEMEHYGRDHGCRRHTPDPDAPQAADRGFAAASGQAFRGVHGEG